MRKLTKEHLQGMSDFEVNVTLADLLNVKWQISAVDDECLMVGSEVLDYCNTPNDIMPLAFERRISLMHCYELNGWMAMTIKHYDVNKNPLRAIACCLILALQEGK